MFKGVKMRESMASVAVKPCVKCGACDRYPSSGRCRPCNIAAIAKWRKENPEKVKLHLIAKKKERTENPEKSRELARLQYQKKKAATPKKIPPTTEQLAELKEQRRLKTNERNRRWYRENLENARLHPIANEERKKAARALIRAGKVKTAKQERDASHYQKNREKKLASVKAYQAAKRAAVAQQDGKHPAEELGWGSRECRAIHEPE